MEKEEQNLSNIRKAELERLVDIFEEEFKSKTTDAYDFITIHEIERMWGDLQQNTLNIYSDMVRDLLSTIDERDLIRKKKREYFQKGIKLRSYMSLPVSVITAHGLISFSRYHLRPQDLERKKKMAELTGLKSIIPLDCSLGIAGLPFKITPNAMLKIAFWAQNQLSYERAEEAIYKIMKIKINDDTIRAVTDFVGKVIFKNDCRKADESIYMLDNGDLRFPNDRDGVLYIQTDGAALNTRKQDENGSTWRENKLGEVFSSKNIRYWTNHKGERQHKILEKEYISYIGSVSEFKKHLFALALRNGYGHYKETVILSDGATWIRNMVEELFPDAQQILDFYHLCENVNTFAKHLFKMDESKYRPWAKDICSKLKKGYFQHVLNELNTVECVPNNCPVNLHGYITNNINNIDYAAYEKKGYFIGSGAIESGNKIILQDRLKRAGMRWNVDTAQALLTLKTKVESKLWMRDVEQPFLLHCFNLSKFI
jgi:hypothetical protein